MHRPDSRTSTGSAMIGRFRFSPFLTGISLKLAVQALKVSSAMRSQSIPLMKHLLSGISAGLLIAACLTPSVACAQDPLGTPPPLQPAATPPPRVEKKAPTPEPEQPTAAAPAATPTPTPRVHASKPKPTPSPDEPVAVVNGAPVYRPLFKSTVNDPVDRALVLLEYRKRGFVLPPNALEEALKNHTKTGFEDPAKLLVKLQEQGATYDDYRSFVGEEVKLQAMLSIVSKGGRSDADRKQLRDTWIAGLRKNAVINKPAAAPAKKLAPAAANPKKA